MYNENVCLLEKIFDLNKCTRIHLKYDIGVVNIYVEENCDVSVWKFIGF